MNGVPECSKSIEGHSRVAYTIDDMENLAKGKSGRCLSRDYINCKTPLLWECEEGHQWWLIQVISVKVLGARHVQSKLELQRE